jgi:hypothetical protein
MVASPTKFQRFSFLHPKNTIKIETPLDYNTSWNFRNTNIVNSVKLVHVRQCHKYILKEVDTSFLLLMAIWNIHVNTIIQLKTENYKSFGNTSENFDNKLQSQNN